MLATPCSCMFTRLGPRVGPRVPSAAAVESRGTTPVEDAHAHACGGRPGPHPRVWGPPCHLFPTVALKLRVRAPRPR
jgi:hypothetical protein